MPRLTASRARKRLKLTFRTMGIVRLDFLLDRGDAPFKSVTIADGQTVIDLPVTHANYHLDVRGYLGEQPVCTREIDLWVQTVTTVGQSEPPPWRLN